MFWSDKVAKELKKRNLPQEWVDDMKTPSGKVHVGALMGVIFHGLVYESLKDEGVQAKYTYVFENHDPMDDIPSYLSYEEYKKYLGMPLYKIPSPEEGYENFAAYYAKDFQDTFNALGFHPEILWTKDLYTSGKMNHGIKLVLDNADVIRNIYKEMYKKDIPDDWFAFQVYCEKCGKVSTTRVYKWDGEKVHYKCPVDATDWTEGCGYAGSVSPFSDENHFAGKMPWKVEWSAKWQAIGVTVEGAGKDHMSRGGSHDLTSLVASRVLDYPVPYPVGYEFMLIGGKKMSSSKGRGFSASDMLTILPPELVRFLFVKMDISKQTNFDPTDPETIPTLFDEYQRYAKAYEDKSDDDLARVFELSQVGDVKMPPSVRFSTLAQWVQMPNLKQKIVDEGLEEWAQYARVWVDRFAHEKDRFTVQEEVPHQALALSEKQKEGLSKIADLLEKSLSAEDFQVELFEVGKKIGLSSKEVFAAIYTALLGKHYGPKAAWLIHSLDKDFVMKRFTTDLVTSKRSQNNVATSSFNNPNLFTIDSKINADYENLSVGIAVIKGVTITSANEKLEHERDEFLKSLEGLTTEKLGEYPEIQSYRKLYKQTGVDWHSRRPSPEALLRRVALHKGLYSVNTCVDAYNLVVMKNRVSVGAFDFDKLSFPTILRYAEHGETIHLLGDQDETEYKTGELAYFDQNGGYNMDFNYRDAVRTAVSTDTKNLYINTEGVFDISPAQVEKALQEACDIIIKYCGGTVEEFGTVIAS